MLHLKKAEESITELRIFRSQARDVAQASPEGPVQFYNMQLPSPIYY